MLSFQQLFPSLFKGATSLLLHLHGISSKTLHDCIYGMLFTSSLKPALFFFKHYSDVQTFSLTLTTSMTMLKVYIHTHIYDVELSFSSAGCKTEAVSVVSLMFSDSASSGMWLTANKDAGGTGWSVLRVANFEVFVLPFQTVAPFLQLQNMSVWRFWMTGFTVTACLHPTKLFPNWKVRLLVSSSRYFTGFTVWGGLMSWIITELQPDGH